jgi:hypothetical protein
MWALGMGDSGERKYGSITWWYMRMRSTRGMRGIMVMGERVRKKEDQNANQTVVISIEVSSTWAIALCSFSYARNLVPQ